MLRTFSDTSVVARRERGSVCRNLVSFLILLLFAFHASKFPSKLVPRPINMGPEYSSCVSGDGPGRKDQESKSTDESPSSDSKSASSDNRPHTPPKPRGMSKRNYKNLVRRHRKKYPTTKPKELANGCQDEQNDMLKIQEQNQIETPTSCKPNPPTPPMSRNMTKRSYKNFVEKHRKKYLGTHRS